MEKPMFKTKSKADAATQLKSDIGKAVDAEVVGFVDRRTIAEVLERHAQALRAAYESRRPAY
jgi:hypothetical protein